MPKKPLFIISQHRTGSTLLKNILNAHSDIIMAFDEMNLFEPFRKNTLDKWLEDSEKTAKQIIDLLLNKEVYGTFWKEFERSQISFKNFEKNLSEYATLNSANVINVVLNLLKLKAGTRYSGVKYPLHFRRLDYLFKYWPTAKVIFLTRNPKSIIASKLNDKATQQRKSRSFFHRFFIHYSTIFYFTIEYIYSARIYFENKNRVKLVTYEDLVKHPDKSLRDICNWCDINFEDAILNVSGKSSSYLHANSNGLHTQSLYKYKSALNAIDSLLISALTNRYYTKIKDELSSNF